MAKSFHTTPASYFITMFNVPCYKEILKKKGKRKQQRLSIFRTAWNPAIMALLESPSEPGAHSGIKAGIFIQVLQALLKWWELHTAKHKESCLLPKLDFRFESWSPKWQSKRVLLHWALPRKITSAFLCVHQWKWRINFIFFLFPKTPVFKGKKEALQTSISFCLLLETRNFILQCEELICFQVFHEISPRSNTGLQAESNTNSS